MTWYLLPEFLFVVEGDELKATSAKLYLLPKCRLKLKGVKPQHTERSAKGRPGLVSKCVSGT